MITFSYKSCSGSNIFMESNYFEAVKRPIMSSLQGTDIKGSKGTFSGENGGMIKSYGNVFVDKPSGFSYITYADNPASFDAYEVAKLYPGFIRVGCCESNGCGMNYGLIYITKRTKPDIFWFLVRFLFSFGNFLSCTFDCI